MEVVSLFARASYVTFGGLVFSLSENSSRFVELPFTILFKLFPLFLST